LIFQTARDQFHQRAPNLRLDLNSLPQQSLHFGNRAHPPPQRTQGVLVQLTFVTELSSTRKCHA